jgi:uroporphyrinogen decarboxylase
MNAKERILAILNREHVDRIPVDLWYTPEIGEALKKHFWVQDEWEMWRAMELDKIAWVFPGYVGYLDGEEEDAPMGSTHFGGSRTMWGTPLRKVKAGEATYEEFGTPPLTGYETPDSLEEFPYWPDPERFDYNAATELARSVSDQFATIGPWVSFFEVYFQMRGLEQLDEIEREINRTTRERDCP